MIITESLGNLEVLPAELRSYVKTAGHYSVRYTPNSRVLVLTNQQQLIKFSNNIWRKTANFDTIVLLFRSHGERDWSSARYSTPEDAIITSKVTNPHSDGSRFHLSYSMLIQRIGDRNTCYAVFRDPQASEKRQNRSINRCKNDDLLAKRVNWNNFRTIIHGHIERLKNDPNIRKSDVFTLDLDFGREVANREKMNSAFKVNPSVNRVSRAFVEDWLAKIKRLENK